MGYFKAEPTEFVRMSAGGKVKKQGKGITAVYMPFRTTIELVSVATRDQPFGFNEVSSDKQDISLQGGIVYQVTNPEVAMNKYNFSVDPKSKMYLNEEGSKLPDHMIQLVQTGAKRIVQATALEQLLVMSEELAQQVLEGMKNTKEEYGIDVGMLYFSSIRPKPEIAKALEAQYRESLLQTADEAIYARRAIAVEKERAIQENELKTRIDLEEKRKEFVDLEGENKLKTADFNAQAAQKELTAYQTAEPATLASLALYELGKNAERIENLTITPDLMATLMTAVRKG